METKNTSGTIEMKKKDLNKMVKSIDVMEDKLLKLEKDFELLEDLKTDADIFIPSLKKVHDLIIYSGVDIDIDKDLKNDLYHLKLLWEALEKLNQ